nr:AAA family ATPase [Streptomyces hoynatensis]
MSRGSGATAPLPAPFRSWDSRSIRFRRASVSMLAGIPGSHKTRLMLNAVLNMQVPTLLFSTDSDRTTVASRILARVTGQPTEETEGWLIDRRSDAAQILAGFDWLRCDFRPDPDLDHIWRSAYAYAEVEGQYPEQIVVDIASDIGHDAGDEWATLRDLMRQSKILARETGAHVLLVHHASDSPNTKRPCPRRSDIHGKVAAIPEVIVTCGTDYAGQLHVACVKNRHAKADPQADNAFPMALDASTSYVGDYVAPQSVPGYWDYNEGEKQ